MNLNLLKIFYTVASVGSLTKASKILNISQSAVSRHMQLFEYQMKVKLFKRHPRGLNLTLAGEKTFKHAYNIIQENENFMQKFSQISHEVGEEIKIITTPAMGETHITSFLLPFLEQYPQLKIKITTSIEKVDVTNADIAIRTFIPHQTDIEQLPLHKFKMKLWASQRYLERFGVPKTAEELSKHRLLVFEENKHNLYSNTNWILHVGTTSSQVRIPFYQITSIEGLHHAAVKGYGIVHLPIEYVKLKGSQLIPVLPELVGPIVDIYYIFLEKLKTSKYIIELYQHLYKSFQDL